MGEEAVRREKKDNRIKAREWVKPEVRRMVAGSAEATFTVVNDGGFSYS